ncbi:MAG: cation transporter [Deltaproteobacteria bacterium]|nr:cation transporter [Deltaproteobacteria bacterium]
MNPIAFRATMLNILGNAGLLALKLAAGILTGSIALISDAINSFNDVAASIATFICVYISDKQADEGHPFGHSRAEPIAGLIIAVLAGILGFEVIREAVSRIIEGTSPEVGPYVLLVPIATMAAKGGMFLYFRRVGRMFRSPAINATAFDSLMDVAVAFAALIGLAGTFFGYAWLDPAAGLLISVWIMYTGYRIGMDNIDYLMGRSPDPWLLKQIKEAALDVPGVEGLGSVKAHSVCPFIHVEIQIRVDKSLPTEESHAIGEEVSNRVESISTIEKSFVHIDPV